MKTGSFTWRFYVNIAVNRISIFGLTASCQTMSISFPYPESRSLYPEWIGGTNLIYTQYINRKYKRSGRLWQNRFFSTIIDKESYLWAVARYIERNPVRAKLVAKAEDYPWSSVRAHISGVTDNVLSDYGWLQTRERDAYREFIRHEEAEFEASVRMATSTGRPLGTETFISRIEKILHREILLRRGGRPRKE